MTRGPRRGVAHLRLSAALATVLAVLTGACRPAAGEMARQAGHDPCDASPFFADGGIARHLPAGTVVRAPRHDAHAPTLADVAAAADPFAQGPVDDALLRRGRERFGIWCAACHGIGGRGDGPVVRRGYPRPPSFLEERLREAPDEHLYRVLTDGLGKMPPYGPHVPPGDRRAILAWIRVLQRSGHATLADVPADARERLARQPEEPR